MGLSIERIEILLLIAAVVAMLARRLRVPYSIGLVFAGIALALSRLSPDVELTKQLVFTLFLPPLIFEAAFQLRWRELRKDLPVILTFATVGASADIRDTYLKAINASLDGCIPLKFTDGLGGALAGRPIAIRYVDNRELKRSSN